MCRFSFDMVKNSDLLTDLAFEKWFTNAFCVSGSLVIHWFSNATQISFTLKLSYTKMGVQRVTFNFSKNQKYNQLNFFLYLGLVIRMVAVNEVTKVKNRCKNP